jgi:hypothetical protein
MASWVWVLPAMLLVCSIIKSIASTLSSAKSVLSTSREQRIKQLQGEVKLLSPVEHFVKCSKLRRRIVAIERATLITPDRPPGAQARLAVASVLATWLWTLPVAATMFLGWREHSTPIAHIPAALVWPLDRLVALPHPTAGVLGLPAFLAGTALFAHTLTSVIAPLITNLALKREHALQLEEFGGTAGLTAAIANEEAAHIRSKMARASSDR